MISPILTLFLIDRYKLTGQRVLDAKIDNDNYVSMTIVNRFGVYLYETKECFWR